MCGQRDWAAVALSFVQRTYYKIATSGDSFESIGVA